MGETVESIAVETGVPLAALREFEAVGLVGAGLPAYVNRERMEVRAALAGDSTFESRHGGRVQSAEAMANEEIERVQAQTKKTLAVIADAVASREEEARLVRANRGAAIALSGINLTLLRGALKVSDALASKLERLDPESLDIDATARLLRTVAMTVKTGAESAKIAVQLERLSAGEPTEIVGMTDAGSTSFEPSTADMSPDDAEKWLAIAQRAFARRAARSTVIESKALVAGDNARTPDGQVVDVTETQHDLRQRRDRASPTGGTPR